MQAIEVDPELLRRTAEAAVHVGDETVEHNAAEVRGSVPGLLDTLAPSEPYGYMLSPEFQPDGSIRMPIASTRDEVGAFYEVVRGRSDVLSEEPIIEVRGTWYAFWESVSTGRRKETGAVSEHPLAILSPVGADAGIDGEIIWPKLPFEMLGTGADAAYLDLEESQRRRALRNMHDRELDALRHGDVDAILANLDDGVVSAVRGYVEDTGRMVELVGRDAHRDYYTAFFDKYDVRSVGLVHRVTQDWFHFAEIRIEVHDKATDEQIAFHTAEIHSPGKNGLLVGRTGYGTDPA
jgi:hypothetical protein